MKALNAMALILAAVGAINWGLVAFAGVNLVAALLGEGALASAVYALVALGGVWSLFLVGKVVTDDMPTRRDAALHDRHPAHPVHARAASSDRGVAKPHSEATTQSATAGDMTAARGHATAVPGPVEGTGGARPANPRGDVASDSAIGTTHDPNSVTTGTGGEPGHDVFPPRAREEGRRLN